MRLVKLGRCWRHHKVLSVVELGGRAGHATWALSHQRVVVEVRGRSEIAGGRKEDGPASARASGRTSASEPARASFVEVNLTSKEVVFPQLTSDIATGGIFAAWTGWAFGLSWRLCWVSTAESWHFIERLSHFGIGLWVVVVNNIGPAVDHGVIFDVQTRWTG